jgi:hypothetical protein
MATLVLGPGAGTGATASFDGTDTEGLITFTTAGTPVSGVILTFEFDEPFLFPGVIVLTPANAEATEEVDCIFVLQNASTASKFVISTGVPALSADVRFQFYYCLVPGSKLTLFTIGADHIHATDDSGNGDLILAQEAPLDQDATLESLSFYVGTAAGDLRLGIYDNTGPSGGPGNLLAETDGFTPAVGWNTEPVLTPVLLVAGTYWLAYCPSSNGLHFRSTGGAIGSYNYGAFPYGPLPAVFTPTPTTGSDHWSFYGTMRLG